MVAIDDRIPPGENGTTFQGFIAIGGTTGGGSNIGFTDDPGYRFNNGFQDYSPAGGPTGVVTGAFHVLEWRVNGGQTYADHQFFSDGLNPNPSPNLDGGGNTLNMTPATPTGGGVVVVGRRFQGSGSFTGELNCRIAECLVYSGALSASDRDDIGEYLALKYNLSTAYKAPILSPEFGNMLFVSATTTQRTIDLVNTGAGTLTVTGVTIPDNSTPGSLSLVAPPATPFTIAAGSTQTLTIQYNSTLADVATGTLTLTSDSSGVAGTVNTVPLEGRHLDTFVSNSSGDWATPTLWTPNGSPSTEDSAEIITGHDVSRLNFLTVDSAYTGARENGLTTLTLSGGTLTTSSPFRIGTGVIDISDGLINVTSAGQMQIGQGDDGTVGKLNVTGGTVLVEGNNLLLGAGPPAGSTVRGEMVIDGGTVIQDVGNIVLAAGTGSVSAFKEGQIIMRDGLLQASLGNLWMGQGNNGTGDFILEGGLVDIAGNVELARGVRRTGSLHISGGKLKAGGNLVANDLGTFDVSWTDGTLAVNGDIQLSTTTLSCSGTATLSPGDEGSIGVNNFIPGFSPTNLTQNSSSNTLLIDVGQLGGNDSISMTSGTLTLKGSLKINAFEGEPFFLAHLHRRFFRWADHQQRSCSRCPGFNFRRRLEHERNDE